MSLQQVPQPQPGTPVVTSKLSQSLSQSYLSSQNLTLPFVVLYTEHAAEADANTCTDMTLPLSCNALSFVHLLTGIIGMYT